MTRLHFSPGFACTPEIWTPAEAHLVDTELINLQWHTGLRTLSAARDHLADCIDAASPDGYVGHSLGGLLLLELLVARRIPSRPALIVDAFLMDPADIFKNYVWEDDGLRDRVTTMLDGQRPRFAALRAALGSWERTDWPHAAIETGAHFVYGGRGSSNDEVIDALGWPPGLGTSGQITIIPRTSHFLMLEAPEAFYALVERVLLRP